MPPSRHPAARTPRAFDEWIRLSDTEEYKYPSAKELGLAFQIEKMVSDYNTYRKTLWERGGMSNDDVN